MSARDVFPTSTRIERGMRFKRYAPQSDVDTIFRIVYPVGLVFFYRRAIVGDMF